MYRLNSRLHRQLRGWLGRGLLRLADNMVGQLAASMVVSRIEMKVAKMAA